MVQRRDVLRALALSGAVGVAGCASTVGGDSKSGAPEEPAAFESCPSDGPVRAEGDPWTATSDPDESLPTTVQPDAEYTPSRSLRRRCLDAYYDGATADVQHRFGSNVTMEWAMSTTDEGDWAVFARLLALTDRERTELREKPGVPFEEFRATVPAYMTGPVTVREQTYQPTVRWFVDCRYESAVGD